MQNTRVHAIICLLASSFSGMQIAIILGFGIWAPAGIIWETFGVHYTAYETLALNYHFIGNAMGFTAVYAYGPSIIAHALSARLPQFDLFQIYLFLVYGLHLAFACCVGLWVARRPLHLGSKVAILTICGVLPLWLSMNYINVLSVNYFWLGTILYPIAATLWLLLATGRLRVSRSLPVFIGAACGTAFWAKFTYAVMLDVFLVLPLLLADWRKSFCLLAVGFVSATAIIASIYFEGHFDYVPRFFSDLLDLYASGYLEQRIEVLASELSHWANPSSALQSVTILAVIAMSWGGYRYWFSVGSVTIFYLLTAVVIGCCVAFIETRTAGNTFMDVVIFLSFVIGTIVALLYERKDRVGAVLLAALYLTLTIWQTFGVFEFAAWLPRLREAGLSAREISSDVDNRSAHSLPVVYYWSAGDASGPIWPITPLWPSPYLYALLSGNQVTKQTYLEKYFPGTITRSVHDGIYPHPHVMIVQEYPFDRSFLTTRTFGKDSDFDTTVGDRSNECSRRTITVAWTDFAIPHRPTITVCTVRKERQAP
jgi:hypothetical protein